tara:strand:- start:212 stop:532 length:321 start_codon:yes stop_codon:yes gene_type:complete
MEPYLKAKVNDTHGANNHTPPLLHFDFVSSVIVLLPNFGRSSYFEQANVLYSLCVVIIEYFFNFSITLGFNYVNHGFPFADLEPVDQLKNLPQSYPDNFFNEAYWG